MALSFVHKNKIAHARTICNAFGSMASLRNKDRMRELCNTMFIQPIIYARARSEHFTFIRIDARAVTVAKNTTHLLRILV